MESLKTYATYLLVLIYIIINLYYKKCINLIIFTVVFIFLYNILNDLNKAIIYSYILSIGYGIFKNFHLLENFDEKKKNNIVFIKDDENLEESNEEPETKINDTDNNSNKINTNNRLKLIRENKKKLYNNIPIEKDITNLLSTNLISKYLLKLRKENINSIAEKTANILNLKPILPEIKKGKIKMMNNAINNKKTDFMNYPIIISNDNFILDGHHRWFLRKTKLNTDSLFNNKFIKVKIIDFDIKTIINQLRDFKVDYNEKLLSENKIDSSRLNDSKNSLNIIRGELEKLDSFYEDINKISFV
jgi:hypothetical protein